MGNSDDKGTLRRKPPAAGKGRPKGAKNKSTTLRENLLQAYVDVFEHLGGVEGFAKWLNLKENKKAKAEFYMGLMPRQFPREVIEEGAGGSGPTYINLIERFIPAPAEKKNDGPAF